MTSNQPGAPTPAPTPSSTASFIPLDRIGSALTGQILSLPAIRSQRKRKAALGRIIKALQILGLAPTGLAPHRVVLGITTLGNGNLALLLTQLPESIPHEAIDPTPPEIPPCASS